VGTKPASTITPEEKTESAHWRVKSLSEMAKDFEFDSDPDTAEHPLPGLI